MEKTNSDLDEVVSNKTRNTKWTDRFVKWAIIHAVLATAITLVMVIEGVGGENHYTTRAFLYTGGLVNPGIWLIVGYLIYMIVGVGGVGVMSIFYRHVEDTKEKEYTGYSNILAWFHLILMNGGIIGATWSMMIGGLMSGVAMLAPELGGLGITDIEVIHDTVWAGAFPIAYVTVISIFLTMIGVILGTIGYAVTWRKPERG